jgi:hypothetical protein
MFRGTYQKIGTNGVAVYYGSGDTIIFEGNLYKNIAPTTNSPFTEPTSWEYLGVYNLYSRSTPPINPKVGQLWENNGVVYTYYYDGNNFSWVQF